MNKTRHKFGTPEEAFVLALHMDQCKSTNVPTDELIRIKKNAVQKKLSKGTGSHRKQGNIHHSHFLVYFYLLGKPLDTGIQKHKGNMSRHPFRLALLELHQLVFDANLVHNKIDEGSPVVITKATNVCNWFEPFFIKWPSPNNVTIKTVKRTIKEAELLWEKIYRDNTDSIIHALQQ